MLETDQDAAFRSMVKSKREYEEAAMAVGDWLPVRGENTFTPMYGLYCMVYLPKFLIFSVVLEGKMWGKYTHIH